MSDNEVEVENPVSGYSVLPKNVTDEIGSIKLFSRWSYEDVEIRDISLTYDEPSRPRQPWTERLTMTVTVTTFKSDPPSTSLTRPADMPQSDSERPNAPSSND